MLIKVMTEIQPMHYKIVGRSLFTGSIVSYFGEFTPREGEHPLLTALARQFGDDPEQPAEKALAAWSGDESLEWSKELADLGPECEQTVFSFNEFEFTVMVGPDPFETQWS